MDKEALDKLLLYVGSEQFKGYDPYDILSSWFPFNRFGKWGPPVAIQLHKRNPIKLRPLLGIKKEINPKAMGLFLKAYSKLYSKTGQEHYIETAHYLFNWLKENYSQGYSGYCWGYNFDWASPGSYLPAYTPSVVVTSFVVDGVYEYFLATGNEEAKRVISSATNYIVKDIPISRLPQGVCFSYTHLSTGCCYNASLLAAEVLAKSDKVNRKKEYTELISSAVDYVLSKQKPTGEWWYSYNSETDSERNQIDFHQGFVLVSLENLRDLVLSNHPTLEVAIAKGLEFYKTEQFYENGRSLWRIPKQWPVDIHNQSQGIITFSRLGHYNALYPKFAQTIAKWTIENMQSKKGYFYYRKTPLFTNKTPYIRWSQAWMLLALVELMYNNEG